MFGDDSVDGAGVSGLAADDGVQAEGGIIGPPQIGIGPFVMFGAGASGLAACRAALSGINEAGGELAGPPQLGDSGRARGLGA